MKIGVIYGAVSPSQKIYIGQTIPFPERIKAHRYVAFNEKCHSYNSKFSRAIRKYGFKNFVWKILYEDISKDKLDIAEMCAIYVFDSYDNGYNSSFGGQSPMRGLKLSVDHKFKISRANSGNENGMHRKGGHSLESKEKISKNHSRHNLGCKLSEERKSQQSLTMKKKYSNGLIKVWNKGLTKKEDDRIISYWLGKNLSQEVKDKISHSLTGKTHLEETKRKQSDSIKESWRKRHENLGRGR